MAQVTRYRWIALSTPCPARIAIHHHPMLRQADEADARAALGIGDVADLVGVEDEDAVADAEAPPPLSCDVQFANSSVARFAMRPTTSSEAHASHLVRLVGRELGGPVRMATLIEESQRLAATDALTGLLNRRAFTSLIATEIARCDRYGDTLSLVLLDVDHFKRINDVRGHAAGDRVLASIGSLLAGVVRDSDHAARWGGEEFVVAYTCTDPNDAQIAAERLRDAIESMVVLDDAGERIDVTASIGLAGWRTSETLDGLVARADAAMYAAKAAGRNRVCAAYPAANIPASADPRLLAS
jgi:diguanylate cyclase (GGDEF)-like protein